MTIVKRWVVFIVVGLGTICVWTIIGKQPHLNFTLHQHSSAVTGDVPQVGTTEKQQLLYYLTHRTRIHQTLPQSKHHNFSFTISTTLTSHRLVVRLTDARTPVVTPGHNHSGDGGASFRTTVSSHRHLYACPFVDYANSTYDVECSWMTSDCQDISVVLLYVDYGAYRWDGVHINKEVWRNRVCQQQSADHTAPAYTGWRRGSEVLPWMWVRNSLVRQAMPLGEVTQCLQNSSSVDIQLIGDSHMREFYHSWMYDIGHPLSYDGRVDVTQHHIPSSFRMTLTSYVVNDTEISSYENNDWAVLKSRRQNNAMNRFGFLVSELNRVLQSSLASNSFAINKRTVIVISVGTWDVAYRNISLFIQYGLPALNKFVNSVQDLLDSNRLRLVVLNAPAKNEHIVKSNNDQPQDREDLSNNAILAAANSLIADVMRGRKNVVVVDFFAMTLTRWDEVVDSYHFVKFGYRPTGKPARSSVGRAVLEELTSEVCDTA